MEPNKSGESKIIDKEVSNTINDLGLLSPFQFLNAIFDELDKVLRTINKSYSQSLTLARAQCTLFTDLFRICLRSFLI
jgi:hypothetical protein